MRKPEFLKNQSVVNAICIGSLCSVSYLAVYFAKTRVKYIKKAVPCAVLGDIAGIAATVFLLRVLGI